MHIARTIVLAVGLLVLCQNINEPFTGWHEDNSAIYSSFARNHIYYGIGYTKLFNIWSDIQTSSTEVYGYLNNPPLLSLWAAIPMYIFGDHEWVARSVSIAATLGSVWILMVIISRLQSPAIGLLTGLFYVMLPITAYFGRVLEYTSATQFFSLLTLHGYLQWVGLYGDGCSRKAGAVYYIIGTVLGIGTGWAVAIMAGLIWFWHIFRCYSDCSLRRPLLWLTVIPVVSLAAVIIHILWGCNWNINWLVDLFRSRTTGAAQTQTHMSRAHWLFANWVYLVGNFSIFGLGAGVIYIVIITGILRYTDPNSPLRQIAPNKTSVAPILLTLLQGLIWIFLFKDRSGIHDYWQYFITPFFAVAMAAVVLTASILLRNRLAWLAFLLILLPLPSFAKSLDIIYQYQTDPKYTQYMQDIVSTLKRLNQHIPPRVPVMISENYQDIRITGDYSKYWIYPRVAYYANRPLIYTTDFNEIQANQQNCAAYILGATKDPNMYRLAQKLGEKYKLALVEANYMIFILGTNDGKK